MIAFSVGAVASLKNVNSNRLLRADEIVPGSITIGQGGNTITELDGQNSFISSNGNPFKFNCINMENNEGIYAFSDPGSRIENIDILNGINSIEFYTPSGKGDLTLDYGFDSCYEDYLELSLDSTHFIHTFNLTKPNYLCIRPMNSSLSFNKIIINYSCSEGERIKSYKSLMQRSWNGNSVSMSENYILAEIDSNITDILLSSLEFKGIALNDPDVTNVSISYSSEEDKTSTKVLDGLHNANVTFDYNGFHYVNESPIQIVGYTSHSVQESSGFIHPSDVRKQSSNDIPEGMEVACTVRLVFYDENNNSIFYLSIYTSSQKLQESMITSSDADRFTGIGQHTMQVNCGGYNVTIAYVVYDPEYNNIKEIGYNDELSIPAGTTTADFLTYILSKENYVVYYEDDGTLPSSITLTADNFVLTPGMFDDYTPAAVPVTIRYGNYEGLIEVSLTAPIGNLLGTYTTDNPIFFLYSDVIGKVELYDNGLCITYNSKDATEYGVTYSYTLTGDLLCIDTVVMGVFRLTLDDLDNSFVRYETTAPLVYENTFALDFTALGAPSDLVCNSKIFDDGFMTCVSPGEFGWDVEIAYTVDSVDSDVIYFKFMGYNCTGTIDETNSKIVVTGTM